jgi:hypothetical protein
MERPKKPRLLERLMTFEMNVGDGISFLYFQLKASLSSFSFGMIVGGEAMASESTLVDSRIQFSSPSIFLR